MGNSLNQNVVLSENPEQAVGRWITVFMARRVQESELS